MIITLEKPSHAEIVESLLDRVFGTDRFKKTTYRLREGVDPIPDLSHVALENDGKAEKVVGTIRYWPVLIGDEPSIMLGPIAVDPDIQGGGLGSKLIRISLNKAFALGHRSVILVGDAPYYNRFGFTRDLTLGMTLPGPVDLSRFLALELVEGALNGVAGPVARAASEPVATARPTVAILGRRAVHARRRGV